MARSVSHGWSLSPSDTSKYRTIFQQNASPQQPNFLTSEQARSVFLQSKLDPNELFTIWNFVDPGKTGRLTVEQFSAAMHLIFGRLSGKSLPNSLPTELQYLVPISNNSNFTNSAPNNNPAFIRPPTSNRSFDSSNSKFSASFPAASTFSQPQSFNNKNNMQNEVDHTAIQNLETEVQKKRTLVAQIPPLLPPVSDQEVQTIKTDIEILYPKVPFHHPNFFSHITENKTTSGNFQSSTNSVTSLKTEIDRLFSESFEPNLTELGKQISQCQVDLFKLEDSIQHGYTLPTASSAPVLPPMSSSGDAIAQKAAAMLAQRMQQLNLANPVQTIPPEAQARIQEKEAQIKQDCESRKSRAEQLIASMNKLRQDFDSLVSTLTEKSPDSTDLKKLASEWQNGSQRASYRVGRLIEELASKGKTMQFPVETQAPKIDNKLESPVSYGSTSREVLSSSIELPSPEDQELPSIKAKDLIKKFSQVDTNNDPFAALVSNKSKSNPPRDFFSEIIQDKEKIEPPSSTKSHVSDSSKQQPAFDPFTVKKASEQTPTTSGSQIPPPPPPPPMPSFDSAFSTSEFSSSKTKQLDSRNIDDNRESVSFSPKISPTKDVQPKVSNLSSKVIDSSEKPKDSSQTSLSDKNPFARLNNSAGQQPQVAETKQTFSNNNPFGKSTAPKSEALPDGVKFAVSALYAYEEPEASITFQPGDVLHVTDDGDDPEGEWYLGHLPDQPEAEDWFPRAFVTLIDESSVPQPSVSAAEADSLFAPSEPVEVPEPIEVPESVSNIDTSESLASWKIVYDFTPDESENTAVIAADSTVVLLDQSDPDWWLIQDPRSDSPPDSQVYVPASFLEQIA